MNSTALRVVWLPILTTLPQSELPGLGSPPSSDLSSDLSTVILGGASLAKLMTDSRGRQSRLDDLSGPGAQSRALCSGCSCETDNGCLYNCDKCGSLCLSCDCSTSQACKYNCDKCEKTGDTDKKPEIAASEAEAEHFLDNLSNQFKPERPVGIVPPDHHWKPEIQPVEAENEDAPSVSPVVSEADDFLGSLNNQFKPEAAIGIVPPSNHWLEPVVAEAEDEQTEYDDDSFSWLDFDPKAASCVADGGPAAGKMCNFPFRYQGKTYYECAPLEGKMLELKETGIHGWCSSHRDINGFHIRGPYAEPWRNVGLCGSGCRIDIKK